MANRTASGRRGLPANAAHRLATLTILFASLQFPNRESITAAETTATSERPLLVPAPGSPIPAHEGGALAAGDTNGDGFADLILVTEKRLSVYFGGAARTWPKAPDVQTDFAAGGSEVALADINKDSNLDVAIADHDSNSVSVLLGKGDGRFVSSEGSPLLAREGDKPHKHGLVIADVNGDSNADIVTANNSDNDLSLLLGNGTGKFVPAPASPFSCGESPYPIAAADVNGDGCADIIVPNATHRDDETKTLTVMLGDKRGNLVAASDSPYECDATVWYVTAGDLNGDKRPDLVAMHSEGNTGATVLLNDGQGTFAPAPGSPLEFGHGAWGVEIADMNRDGKGDIVVAADESIRVLLGDGDGRFTPAAGSPFKTGKGAWRLVVGDFNGDGQLDLATRCVEARQLDVYLCQ